MMITELSSIGLGQLLLKYYVPTQLSKISSKSTGSGSVFKTLKIFEIKERKRGNKAKKYGKK